MTRVAGEVLALFLVVSLAAAAPAHADPWQSELILYGLLPSVEGRVGVGEVESEVEVSLSDILDKLQTGAMVTWVGTRGRWMVVADGVFANLGTTTRSEGGLVRADVDLDVRIFEGDVGYALNEQFQLFVGARFVDLGAEMELRVGDQERRAKGGESWVDPVLGLRFTAAGGERWLFRAHVDAGGFGVGSSLRLNASASALFRLTPRVRLGAGYRVVDVDYDQGTGRDRFLFDARIQGPMVGATYSF